jgi:hypothetical protein
MKKHLPHYDEDQTSLEQAKTYFRDKFPGIFRPYELLHPFINRFLQK